MFPKLLFTLMMRLFTTVSRRLWWQWAVDNSIIGYWRNFQEFQDILCNRVLWNSFYWWTWFLWSQGYYLDYFLHVAREWDKVARYFVRDMHHIWSVLHISSAYSSFSATHHHSRELPTRGVAPSLQHVLTRFHPTRPLMLPPTFFFILCSTFPSAT